MSHRKVFLEAVKRRDHAAVRELLSEGVNPDTRDILHGYTALHYAVQTGDRDLVRLLIRRGANLCDFENNVRCSPLSIAALRGDKAMVVLLLRHGCKLSPTDVATDLIGDVRAHARARRDD